MNYFPARLVARIGLAKASLGDQGSGAELQGLVAFM